MNFKHFLTTAFALLAASVASFAYFSQGDAGQEVFSFINTFDSPRNAALEKSAGAGISTDPTITQLNPAAVILPENKNHVPGTLTSTFSRFRITGFRTVILKATTNMA